MMRMIIKFSAYGDGPRNPQKSAAGEVVVGPAGLLGLLEQHWGLQRREASQAVRIGQYVECLASSIAGNQFYAKSFEADPWETARTLLSWRDELVLAGWHGQPLLAGSRIAVLAEVEGHARERLSSGFSDRLRELILAVRERPASTDWLASVELLELRQDYEPWWQALFLALEQRGVSVMDGTTSAARADGDLGQAQALLTGSSRVTDYRRDGSLTLLWADGEGELAEVLASWLNAGANDDVVLVAESRSELLDRTVKAAGIPGLGVMEPSPNRTLFQVLPSAWETFWAPPSINAYLQWLALPLSPIPAPLRHRLADALTDTPGIGGKAWVEVLNEARESQIERVVEHYPSTEHAKRMAQWDDLVDFWFAHKHFDPQAGIPKTLLSSIVFRTHHWLIRLASQNTAPIIQQAAAAAGVMGEVIAATSAKDIPQALLNRMWDSVIGIGARRWDSPEDVAPWRLISHPGAVFGPAPTIVWWRFEEAAPTRSPSPWTAAERGAIEHAGMILDRPDARLRREALGWMKPIVSAQARVLLLACRETGGSASFVHPLWDALSAGGSRPLQQDARPLFQQGWLNLAGRRVTLEPMQARRLPPPQRRWPLAPGLIPRRPVESATSLEMLFSCSLRWVLEYGLKARPMDVLRLPPANRMVGVLVHAIVSDMLDEKAHWAPKETADAALERFDRFVPEMAAPLLEPHQRMVYLETRREIGRAVEMLFEQLTEHHVEVIGTERKKSREWRASQRIEGTLDLELANAQGSPVVWDLKWSKSRRFATAVQDRNAVQLAVYAWLMDEGVKTQSAYVLLRNGQVIWTKPSGDNDWERVERSYDHYFAMLQEEAVATGIPDESPLVPVDIIARAPDCPYCSYHHLCGTRRLQ